ncbi:MAG: hypothetical protein AAF487_07305 [Bacteroidota bacterium]
MKLEHMYLYIDGFPSNYQAMDSIDLPVFIWIGLMVIVLFFSVKKGRPHFEESNGHIPQEENKLFSSYDILMQEQDERMQSESLPFARYSSLYGIIWKSCLFCLGLFLIFCAYHELLR